MRNIKLLLVLKTCLIIFALLVLSCKSKYESYNKLGLTIEVDSLLIPDSSATLIISPYKNQIDVKMNEIIGYSDYSLSKGQPEGLLNNYISDLVLNYIRTHYTKNNKNYDITVFNNGGLRASLPRGAIKVGDIYKLMPFENEVVVLELSGEQFYELIKYIVASGGVPFSGMRILASKQEIISVNINNQEFDKNKTYTVITSDYLANGGDKMHFFSNPISYTNLDILLRDLIIDHFRILLKEDIAIEAKLDGRLKYE